MREKRMLDLVRLTEIYTGCVINSACPYFLRYGSRDDWIYEGIGCDRELQVKKTGRPQCHRSCGDDHSVRPLFLLLNLTHHTDITKNRVDDILRAAPRKREAV